MEVVFFGLMRLMGVALKGEASNPESAGPTVGNVTSCFGAVFYFSAVDTRNLFQGHEVIKKKKKKKKRFVDILKDYMIKSAASLALGQLWVFQQDNDLKDLSGLV